MFEQVSEERRASCADAVERLSGAGARLSQVEFPDIHGVVRGKISGIAKALSPGGTGISTLMMSTRSGDDLVLTPWSDFTNGFPKMVAVADPTTAVHWAWRPEMSSVLCDLFMDDGTPCPLDGRQLLRRVAEEYAVEGLEARAALEWEFHLFDADDDAMRNGRQRDLNTFGRGVDFYSITRPQSFVGLASEFLDRTAGVGIEVEAFHTEYGHGMYEYTCSPSSVLKAADDAIRSKLYLRQLCEEHSVIPSFMPAMVTEAGDSHSGCHHNLSVWSGGKNVFWDAEARGLSDLGRWFAGGALEALPDFHLVSRPWVNSYRRFDRLSWNPVDVSWGLDNHATALRLVHGALPAKQTRIEHRAPSPDVNPYLSLAAIFWSGLHGIRTRIEPPPLCSGDPVELGHRNLPSSLPDSIDAFRSSALTRQCFGDLFVDMYAATKTDEWNAFVSWAKENDVDPLGTEITGWEYQQYFTWC